MSIENLSHPEQAEKERLLKEVIDHVKKMRAVTDPSKRKCVDGGYKENEAVGATAIPGADLGVSLALLEMGYSPQDAFDLVYEFDRGNDQPYYWHTDTHEGHGDCVVGCGHFNAAIGNVKHYGVKSDEVNELLDIVRQNQEKGVGMDMMTLDREHAEKGVLVVTSPDYTVKPWDQEDDVQYFIYDQTGHQKLLQDFVEFWKSKGRDIDYDSLLDVSNNQTNSTLGLLGSSKGKPMYSVDASNETPVVTYLKDAPVID